MDDIEILGFDTHVCVEVKTKEQSEIILNFAKANGYDLGAVDPYTFVGFPFYCLDMSGGRSSKRMNAYRTPTYFTSSITYEDWEANVFFLSFLSEELNNLI